MTMAIPYHIANIIVNLYYPWYSKLNKSTTILVQISTYILWIRRGNFQLSRLIFYKKKDDSHLKKESGIYRHTP